MSGYLEALASGRLALGLDPQAPAGPSPYELGVRTLPASSSYPFELSVGADGTLYSTGLTLIDRATAQPWRLTIVNGAVTLQAIPTVADIRADFASVAAARDAAGTVAGLRRWGF